MTRFGYKRMSEEHGRPPRRQFPTRGGLRGRVRRPDQEGFLRFWRDELVPSFAQGDLTAGAGESASNELRDGFAELRGRDRFAQVGLVPGSENASLILDAHIPRQRQRRRIALVA